MSEMSEKIYEIRGLMDSAESLHVEIPMFVGKEDASCGNGGTMARKVTLAICANLPVLGLKMLPQVTSAISAFYAEKGINLMQHIQTAKTKTTGKKLEPARVRA